MRTKQKQNPWISQDILNKMYQRDFMHSQAIKTKSYDNWQEYRNLRNDITKQIRDCRKQFFTDQINNNSNNSKYMWKTLKTLLPGQKDSGTGPLPIPASDFNTFFGNIGYDLTKHIQVPESTCNNSTNYANKFSFPLLSVCDTMKLMKTVPNTHILDPLDIDGYLLRISLPAIAPSLTYIYNLSLQTGDVHPDWKLARITPIYKGDGSRKDPSSYRPISVTSHLIKPLERHVKNALMTHLLNCDLFSERQAAFIKGHSTTTVLHAMTDDWLRAIDNGLLVASCMLDMRKGFDILNHDLLLDKLRSYGVTDENHAWFESYLSFRNQYVKCNNTFSSSRPVTTGVPQGTVLGPLLFLIFVNDLLLSLEKSGTSVYMYADDITIYSANSDLGQAEASLQNAVDSVQSWFKNNKLLLNPKKSHVMLIGTRQRTQEKLLRITVNETTLDQKDHVKLLGIHIDKNLTWSAHTEKLGRDLNRRLPLLNRLAHIIPKKSLKTVFNCLIQSKIDYCLSVWGNCCSKNINLIQRIQNRAARIITSNTRNFDIRSSDILRDLGWMSVKSRFKYFMLMLVFKAIHGNAPKYLINTLTFACSQHKYNTRFANGFNLSVPKTRTHYFKSSFQYLAPELWNILNEDVKNAWNLFHFKRDLKIL